MLEMRGMETRSGPLPPSPSPYPHHPHISLSYTFFCILRLLWPIVHSQCCGVLPTARKRRHEITDCTGRRRCKSAAPLLPIRAICVLSLSRFQPPSLP